MCALASRAAASASTIRITPEDVVKPITNASMASIMRALRENLGRRRPSRLEDLRCLGAPHAVVAATSAGGHEVRRSRASCPQSPARFRLVPTPDSSTSRSSPNIGQGGCATRARLTPVYNRRPMPGARGQPLPAASLPPATRTALGPLSLRSQRSSAMIARPLGLV